MGKIEIMGHFTAIGMRTKVEDPNALIINTCGENDTANAGSMTSWVWSNPTNRAIKHQYADIEAVSVECMWQGTKIMPGTTKPDPSILCGAWRKNKGKRPAGAYVGDGTLITDPGTARRKIYIPAFRNLVSYWQQFDEVRDMIAAAQNHDGAVYLRDFDTGRGLDRRGPVSHAWVLATYLNTGKFPD